MDLIDIAAILGALAWLPQLGQWAYKYATKPQLVLIPVRNFELGFSVYGPMLNLRAALGAERKDATITLATAKLRHERGRNLVLHWTSFTETFSQMREKSGDTTEIEREQAATALRVSTAFLTEKFIRFQDGEFQNRALQLFENIDALKERLEKASTPLGTTVITSKEYTELIGHFRHAFCWEAGKYDFDIELDILGIGKPSVAQLSFILEPAMIDRLRANLELLEAGFRARFSDAETEASGQYFWANPVLDTSRLLRSSFLPSR